MILAGVSIGLLLGENGIINRAKESREKTEIAGESYVIPKGYHIMEVEQ